MLATRPKKRAKLRHNEYYDMQNAFDKLYADSQKGEVFTNLLALIAKEENIRLAYRNIKNNKGSHTGGMDRATIEEIKTLNAENYVERIRQMLTWYTPGKVRRKEIPKPNGKMRPLGIPTIWDRLLQQCVLQVLDPICEARFHDRSNGFRPNRSARNAVAQCYNMIHHSKLYFVVDIDIKGFFDNVNHTKLIQQMWSMGIRDKNLLCIIRKMLKAPVVMPNGRMFYPDKGTPQGGILSPLLSNIVLNELDWWVASNWELFPTKHHYLTRPNSNGSLNNSNMYTALKKHSALKEMFIVRYADDFKIFCRTRSDADRTFHAVKQWLSDRLKLEISEEKSKVTNLKKHYTEFLGISMKAKKKGNKYAVKSHIVEKALCRIKENLKAQLVRVEFPKSGRNERLEINVYNSMVMGIHNYYDMATNVSLDLDPISNELRIAMKNRLRKRLKRKGEIKNKIIRERYGASKQMRFVNEHPIIPLGYVKTRPPRWKKREINAYTIDGRAAIHKNIGINTQVLHQLMRQKEGNRTIEYMDNRLSLYCAQYGKCAITGSELEVSEIHCHHILPKRMGGNDAYQNLIIVHEDVHRLIHAIKDETVRKYMAALNLDSKMLKKLNKLRQKAGNSNVPE